MADRTAAERQRRYRAHKRGDHTLCGSGCDPSTVTSAEPVTRNAVTVELGRRGRRLWDQITTDRPELGPGERVLLEEACRTADRLDRLDGILTGDPGEWMRFRVNDDGSEVTVTLDRALSEARQQQLALRALVAELRPRAVGKPAAPPGPQTGGTGVPAGVTSLAARIAAKRSTQTAG